MAQKKKPKYPLQVYLTHILGEKERLQTELREAERKHEVEQEKYQTLEREFQQLESDFHRWKGEYETALREGTLNAQDIRRRNDHLKRVQSDANEKRREMLAQQRALQRTERAVEKAREDYQNASNEVKIHEEKKQRWLDDWKREEMRKEQKQIEEISSAMFERRRRQQDS